MANMKSLKSAAIKCLYNNPDFCNMKLLPADLHHEMQHEFANYEHPACEMYHCNMCKMNFRCSLGADCKNIALQMALFGRAILHFRGSRAIVDSTVIERHHDLNGTLCCEIVTDGPSRIYANYYKNGLLALRFSTIDDYMDGEYCRYHINGQVKKAALYDNGALCGPIKYYSMDGVLVSTKIRASSGVMRQEVYEDGKVAYTINFR